MKPESKASRRLASTRKRLKQANIGDYLAEEPLRMCAGAASSTGEPLNGSAQSPFVWSEAAIEANGEGRVGSELSSPWREIYDIEYRIAHAVAASDGDALTAAVDDLSVWFEVGLSESGILRQSAVETPRLVPLLVRLRSVLRHRGWRSSFDPIALRVFRSTLERCTHGGWLLGPEAGLSPDWHRMLKGVQSPAEFARVAEAIDRLQRGKRAKLQDESELGIHCEEGRFACLRSDFSRRAAQVAIDFSEAACPVEVRISGRSIVRGGWQSQVEVDGREIPVAGNWSSVCWNSDEDGQFLELNLELEDGVTLDRQIYVSRKSPILFLVDIVRASGGERIGLEWGLPSPSVGGLAGVLPTRAQQLLGLPFDARLLPLSFPANPLEPCEGVVTHREGSILVSHGVAGSALIMPVAIVWDKSCLEEARVWRPLTITNDRRVVGPTEAMGWRIPHAGRQIIYFRSTLGVCRLAFVGHQTFNECVIGEIDRKGVMQEWVAIDSEPDKPLPW